LTDAPCHERMALADHSKREPELRVIFTRGPRPLGAEAKPGLSARPQDEPHAVGGNDVFIQEWVSESGDPPRKLDLQRFQAPYKRFDSRNELKPGSLQLWPSYSRRAPAITVRGYLAIGVAGVADGRVYFIKDGVVLNSKPLGARFAGCLAFWSDPRLRTDLSQVRVLQDEVYSELHNNLTEQLLEAARHLLHVRDHPRSQWRRLATWRHGQPSLDETALWWARQLLGSDA